MMDKAVFKEKVISAVEKNTVERLVQTRDISEDDLINSLFSDEFYSDDLYTEIKNKAQESCVEEQEEDEENTAVAKVHVVEADEITPEIVEYITGEVVTKLQNSQTGLIKEFIRGSEVSQEDFFKIQLWSYFPFIGIPIYFFFLMALSINRNNRYNVSIQNYAKAQLKTFWVYAIAHLSVLFVTVASMVSLVNIIERGLAA